MTDRLKVRLTLVACFCAAIMLYYSFRQTITNYPSKGIEIVAFGDSLVQGVGSVDYGDFVSVLSKKIHKPIINLGHRGDTTAEGIARLKDLDNYNPKVVLLLFGGNDYLESIPIPQIEKNLSILIENIQARGAVVVLLAVRGGIFNDNFDKMYKHLRDQYHTAYVSDVLEGLYGNKNLMSDIVHPNNDGYRVMADRIYPIISSVTK
jgi:lysophospholipase L1-like esterase